MAPSSLGAYATHAAASCVGTYPNFTSCSLHIDIAGSGTVALSPGPTCTTSCDTQQYPIGTKVTITVTAGTGSTFGGWSGVLGGNGNCEGTTTSCQVVVDNARYGTATFSSAAALALSVQVVKTASPLDGTVTINPPGATCSGGTCTNTYTAGQTVTLTANPGNAVFGGWGSACSGTATTCTLTINADTSVTATFKPPSQPPPTSPCVGTYPNYTSCPLHVDISGSGSVAFSPGSTCTSSCDTAQYAIGTVVTITVTPATGSAFAGWSGVLGGNGNCEGTTNPCHVGVDGYRSGTATLSSAANPALSLRVIKTASPLDGSVTITPPGANCSGGTCTNSYTSGQKVTLTENPGTAIFGGWGGACSGTATTCTLTINADTSVTATFNSPAQPPPPPTGGATCVGTYPSFTSCSLHIDIVGSGSVAFSPGPICTTSCDTPQYAIGTRVTITATAAAAAAFGGWSGVLGGNGNCEGRTNPCQVGVDNARYGTATFSSAANPALSVQVVKTASPLDGTVTIDPPGGTCSGGTCTNTYSAQQRVTITASPGHATFGGWGGACGGTTSMTCTVVMDADKQVTLTFGPSSVADCAASSRCTVHVGIVGNGNVLVSPPGHICPASCDTGPYAAGTRVTLLASPVAGSTFTGWTGDCAATSPTCSVVVDSATRVTATFAAVSQGQNTPPPSAPVGATSGSASVNGQPFAAGVIPYGSIISVEKGALKLATDAGELTVFPGGGVATTFQLIRGGEARRTAAAAPIVVLRLVGGSFAGCGRSAAASGKKRRVVRRLVATAHGHFRTDARLSTASVHGTSWQVDDRCDGTLTIVHQGVVAVYDRGSRKTVLVRTGGSYLARPHR